MKTLKRLFEVEPRFRGKSKKGRIGWALLWIPA
jgi:hypothetical protein